ncbi:MAG: helix-turn-helix domain-containing protein [Ferruginibacter sp.]
MFFTNFNATLFLIIVSVSIIISFILIFSKPENKQRAFCLAVFLMGISFFGLEKYSQLTNHPTNLYFKIFSLVILHAVAAGIFLYFSTFLRSKRTFRVWIFFLPFLIIAFTATVLLAARSIHAANQLIPIIKASLIISFAFFIFYTATLFKQNRQTTTVSKNVVYLFILICIALLIFFAENIIGRRDINTRPLEYLEVLIIVIIYWLAFFGYLRIKTEVVQTEQKEPKYFKSLTEEEIERCLQLILSAFEKDKVYLSPELNLPGLSQTLKVSPRLISAVLNQKLNKGFNEFLNEYRIAEATQLLKDPQKSNLTIAAIAYDSGFNSLATFQRMFKKITGLTPREFLAN